MRSYSGMYPTCTILLLQALLLRLQFSSTLTAAAFSSSAVLRSPTLPSYPTTGDDAPNHQDGSSRDTGDGVLVGLQQSSVIESVPWRVVLDIGREPALAAQGMPFDWGRSGCRMPLKIPCQFSKLQSSEEGGGGDTTNLCVTPISDTVNFTGPEGAVVRPVQGGDYSLVYGKNSGHRQPHELTFDLTFPETLTRRDVTIAAGTTLQCTGTLYTQSQLHRLDQEFYQARDAVWSIGQELNDQSRRRDAPKQWNEQTQKWEQRPTLENPLSWMQHRVSYWRAKARQDEKNRQRPSANELSSVGRWPGVDDPVYIAKGGIVRAAANGAVLGNWYAEPVVTHYQGRGA